MFDSFFHGILCDTPKKSRGKNLVIIPIYYLDISLCRALLNALVETFNQCKTYELTCDCRSWRLTIKSIHIINTSLMSDEMPFYHSFAEVMTYALFYRMNAELGNIFTTNITIFQNINV